MDYVALAREWQSLIAGVLGVVAGIIAYVGAIKAANRQVAALKVQIEDAQAVRHQTDERRLSVIKWAIRAEGRRLNAAVSALRRALPARPQTANRRREQLVIESSPLLRGEWEEMALLEDHTRAVLEKVAGIVGEYNLRIETTVVSVEGPLIDQDILNLVDHLAVAVKELRSIV